MIAPEKLLTPEGHSTQPKKGAKPTCVTDPLFFSTVSLRQLQHHEISKNRTRLCSPKPGFPEEIMDRRDNIPCASNWTTVQQRKTE